MQKLCPPRPPTDLAPNPSAVGNALTTGGGTAAHVSWPGVEPASIDERIIEKLANLAPGLGDVIGYWSLEIGRTQKTGPTLVAGGRVFSGGGGKGQGHKRESS